MNEAIAFAGTPANAAHTLEALHNAGVPIDLVITKPDAAVGRKRVLTVSPVAATASQLGLELVKAESVDAKVIEKLQASGVRLGVIVAYGSLLNEAALDALELGWLNLHYSLLPKYRGAAPVQRAIYEGESETGVTVFKLDSGLDTGLIASSVPVAIAPSDNAESLLAKLTEVGISCLLEDIPKVLHGVAQWSRQTGEPSKANKISRQDSRLNCGLPARRLESIVRACNPEPGAWLELKGEVFKIHDAVAVTPSDIPVGRVANSGGRVLLGCGDQSALVLKLVQPAGKRIMEATDWYRGVADEVSFE